MARSIRPLRRREFSRLDQCGHAYLDYTGAALYPQSLVADHARLLEQSILGNPHSVNPASEASSQKILEAREAVLRFLNADPDRYQVIFTANASGAIKLVAESFPFTTGSAFGLTTDNHNSINGIREFAKRRGAEIVYLPMNASLGMDNPSSVLGRAEQPSLFAYPGQSNFSGIKHSLNHVRAARELGYRVLLDAAALVPSTPLDLDRVGADFVCLSFYKIFGYPTGIGALVARREAVAELQRPWFAGGTVDFASTMHPIHQLAASEDAFEDGTPDFASADAVIRGIDFMTSIGMQHVADRVEELVQLMVHGLRQLRHRNGQPKVRWYGGPDQSYGGARAINLLDEQGQIVPYELVESLAGSAGLSIRGGCFCNPGCAEAAFGFEPEPTRQCLDRLTTGFSPDRLAACLGHAAVGAIRVSLGIANDESDIRRLIRFVDEFRSA